MQACKIITHFVWLINAALLKKLHGKLGCAWEEGDVLLQERVGVTSLVAPLQGDFFLQNDVNEHLHCVLSPAGCSRCTERVIRP